MTDGPTAAELDLAFRDVLVDARGFLNAISQFPSECGSALALRDELIDHALLQAKKFQEYGPVQIVRHQFYLAMYEALDFQDV